MAGPPAALFAAASRIARSVSPGPSRTRSSQRFSKSMVVGSTGRSH